MYGLIGKIMATDGSRDELISILLDGTGEMPGCLSYVVARDPNDDNGIWITEVWTDAEKHGESLTLPSVKKAIERGRPLIAGFGERFETIPIGGQGI